MGLNPTTRFYSIQEHKDVAFQHCLVAFLQGHSLGGSTGDQTLQHTFIQYLLEKVAKPERDPDKVEEWVEEISTVLSVMPWGSEKSGGHFETLCETLWATRDGPLKEERVLSSLLRPQCNALVLQYCTTALRLQRDHFLKSTPETQGMISVYNM